MQIITMANDVLKFTEQLPDESEAVPVVGMWRILMNWGHTDLDGPGVA